MSDMNLNEEAERVFETLWSVDETLILRREDGSVIREIDASGEKPPSKKKIAMLLRYNYNSTQNPPPGNSQIRGNSPGAEGIQLMWVHRSDSDNTDAKNFLLQLKKDDQIYLQDVNNADSYAYYTLSDDSVDNGSYVTLPVNVDVFSGDALAGSGILLGLMT